MSGRAAAGARGGGGSSRRGRGDGRGRGRFNYRRGKKKGTGHVSNTPAIANDTFDCGKAEHAGQFEKARKAVINYFRMSGDPESALVADSLEQMAIQAINAPPIPPRVEDPNNMGQNPPIMVDNLAETLIWEGTVRGIGKR